MQLEIRTIFLAFRERERDREGESEREIERIRDGEKEIETRRAAIFYSICLRSKSLEKGFEIKLSFVGEIWW